MSRSAHNPNDKMSNHEKPLSEGPERARLGPERKPSARAEEGGEGGAREDFGAVLGRVIAERRREKGWSVQRLADEAGCAKSYVSDVENANKSAGDDVLSRIERALGFEPGALVNPSRWERAMESGGPTVAREVSRRRDQSHAAGQLVAMLRSHAGGLDEAFRTGALRALIQRAERLQGVAAEDPGQESRGAARVALFAGAGSAAREVPLINKVAAGYPTEFTDLSYPARMADEYIRCPDITDPDAFAARVVGDSMAPDYREGDIVVFSPAKAVKDGDDCFARLEPDSETTFKRVYFEKGADEAEMIRLQPINNKYGARVFERERVAGLYAAVSQIRRIGG